MQIRGKVEAVEWRKGEARGPMVYAAIIVELTRSRRQGDADAQFSRLKTYVGKEATLIID